MKRVIILTCAVMMILAGMLDAVPIEKQEPVPAGTIAEQLQDIEEHFVKSRERVETFYAKQQKELKLRAEQKIKLVEEAERADLAKKEEIKKNQYYQTHGVFPRDGLFSQEEIASAEIRVAQEKESILAQLDRDIQRLEKQRNYTLNNQLPYQEARLKKDLLSPEPEPPVGTVTGIVYSKDRQSALINHKIVESGDVLHGVKIVAIYQNRVEFKKNGNIWKQRPGQSPETFDWQ